MFKWRDKNYESVIGLYPISKDMASIGAGKICNHCKFCCLRQQPHGKKPMFSNRWLTTEEFRTILYEKLGSRTLLYLNTYPVDALSSDIFDHPQAPELCKILLDWSEQVRDDAIIHLLTVGVADDESVETILKIKNLRIQVSLNFLNLKDREDFMNSPDMAKEIERVIEFGNKTKHRTNVYTLYSSDNREGMIETFKRFRDNFSDAKANTQDPERKFDPSEWGTLLKNLGATKYHKNQTNRNRIISAKPSIVENADLAFEKMPNIKDFITVSDLWNYYPISDIIERFSDYENMVNFHKFLLNSFFRQKIEQAFEAMKDRGYSADETGFITSEANSLTAKKEYPDLNWLVAKNSFYGGTINCAGLLSFGDIRESIEKNRRYNVYIAPVAALGLALSPGNLSIQTGYFNEDLQTKVDVAGNEFEPYFGEESGIKIGFF